MSRFVPSPDAAASAQRDLVDALRKASGEMAQRAAVKVPRRTGRYARSLRVFNDDRGIGVESTDVAGHIIESGSVNNPAYAPLRQAASETASRFEPR